MRLALELGEHRLAEHRAAEAVEQVPGEERLRLFVARVALHQRAQNEDVYKRQGERHVVFYDPPVVNRQLGIRAGSIPETRNIAAGLLRAGVQSIVFARARLTVEVLVRYLKDMVRDPLGNAGRRCV